MIRIIKHEWHQVDSQYELILEREELDMIYPDLNSEEQDEIWKQILDGEYDFQELIEDASSQDVWIDWVHHYDDWWTARKGGYDVTYDVEDDYEPPKTDQERITDLRNEVNELCRELGIEDRYDTRPIEDRLKDLMSYVKDREEE